jgi:hypothetical protein
MKHFFDTIYYPCLQATAGRPWAIVLHGNDDAAGAVTLATKITTGLGWRPHRPPLPITGPPTAADREACWDLAATLAAELIIER